MQGAGVLTVIALLLFALLIGTFVLTMGKDYMQYWTVRSIVIDVAKTPGAAERTPHQIWNEIERRFTINSIYDNVERENFTFEEDGGGRYMLLSYEVRRPFFGNLDLVANFNRRETLAP
ncbi:hypothetical protein TVNIR_0827 [Thioalkalivibrio nitratireducens DSM 14787]|uniref:Transmembrane protein n=2 Tax=Thioalkalivibrio nitratireducens TaxID=186931 RepID=L0DU28_THIND|nr:DUF4845 domain-containing protein [Thioalkalivibrio nitratireducens]AGA32517.1 hypothetical protein TVNIR_0827 [Thioalkalivibrio nitratireducens DSM 14787]